MIIRDITERKHKERILQDIFSKNPTAFQIVDKDGLTLSVNPAYINLFGAAQIQVILFLKIPNLNRIVVTGIFINGSKTAKLSLSDLNYHTLASVPGSLSVSDWTQIIVFPLKDKIGKEERYLLMFENINRKKQSEMELIYAKETAEESDRLKSAFLANISHEIRTPMNGIMGFSELLKEPALDSEEQRIYIQKIKESGDRLLNIINEIIDMSRVESEEIKVNISETNINEQIKNLYTLFKTEVKHKGLLIYYKIGLPTKEAIIKNRQGKN